MCHGARVMGHEERDRKVLSNIYTGVIWLTCAWSWHPKFLVGRATVTVGGSFCQERRMGNHETVREREIEREREREWTTDRHDIRKESGKVNRQFIAQWSKKRERWKALTWVKLRVIGGKGNWNTKVCLSGRNWTSWKVNNTGWAFEALILRSWEGNGISSDCDFFWSDKPNEEIILNISRVLYRKKSDFTHYWWIYECRIKLYIN